MVTWASPYQQRDCSYSIRTIHVSRIGTGIEGEGEQSLRNYLHTCIMFTQPEEYTFAPTSTVPNNVLPVLVYRNVLPQPRKESTTQEFLEANEWMKGASRTCILYILCKRANGLL